MPSNTPCIPQVDRPEPTKGKKQLRKNLGKRSMSAAFAMMVTITAAVFGLASPASAASGTIYTTVGDGYLVYNVNEANNTLTFSVTTGVLPAGQCVTGYVDLKRTAHVPAGSGTHYDIRANRVCRPYTTQSVGIQYEGSTYGIDVIGIQKLAVCRGLNNQMGTCNNPTYNQPGGSITSASPVYGNYCTRMWRRNADNSSNYWGAGNVFSCQS